MSMLPVAQLLSQIVNTAEKNDWETTGKIFFYGSLAIIGLTLVCIMIAPFIFH